MDTLRWTVGSRRSASFGCSAEAKFTLDTTGSLPRARQRVESSHCRIRFRFQTSKSCNLLLRASKTGTRKRHCKSQREKKQGAQITQLRADRVHYPIAGQPNSSDGRGRHFSSAATSFRRLPRPVGSPSSPCSSSWPPCGDACPSREQTQGPPFRTLEPTTDNSSSS